MYTNTQIPEEFPNPLKDIYEGMNEIKSMLKSMVQSTQALSPEEDKLLNIREAAEYINLSVPSMYRLCGENKLPSFKKGKKILFSKDELTAWIREGRRKTISEIKEDAERYLGAQGEKKRAINLKTN